jgi:FkbM family methyltransferase
MNTFNLQQIENYFFYLFSKKISNKHLIDVGAHIGSDLHYFVKSGFFIDAFEPIEQNRIILENNFELYDRIKIHPVAVSNSSGEKDFQLAIRKDGSLHEFYHSFETFSEDDFHRKGEIVKIKAVSLNDLIDNGLIPKKVGLLKIDTEGHDLKVIEGASNIESEVICVEFWSDNHPLGKSPSPPEKMIELLKNNGYQNYIIIGHKDENIFLTSENYDFKDNSWGNIFFFNIKSEELFKYCISICPIINKGIFNNKFYSNLLFILGPEFHFFDIGANNGDFTNDILSYFPDSKGFLFEPTHEVFDSLKNRFQDNPNISIYNIALGNKKTKKDFYICGSSQRNSFLIPLSSDSKFKQINIEIDLIDNLINNNNDINKIDFIKIDTQGYDLKVLQGAINTIIKFKPVVLTEFIFSPLYKDQGSYYEIFSFFKEIDYKLVGLYNVHYNNFDLISYCDMLFIASYKYDELFTNTGFLNDFYCSDVDYLQQQNKMLQNTCEERLDLINKLNNIALERLKVIEILDTEIKRIKVNN